MEERSVSNVLVEYRDGMSTSQPILTRKYTVTHSDDSGELYVTIGDDYAWDKIGPLRDEVLLVIQIGDQGPEFYGTVLIDEESGQWNSKVRNQIFLNEMPKALSGVRVADRYFFEKYPMLDELRIYIWFQSTDSEYNRYYDFGQMKDYNTTE